MQKSSLLISMLLMSTAPVWAFTLNDAWQAAREHSSEFKQAHYQFEANLQQNLIFRFCFFF